MKKISLLIVSILVSMCFVSCNQSVGSGAATVEQNAGAPGPRIEFDSLDDMRKYILAGMEGATEEKPLYYDRIAPHLIDAAIVNTSHTLALDYFGSGCSINYNAESFSLTYVMDGVIYHFYYSFDDTEKKEYDGTPWVKDVSINSVMFDLYPLPMRDGSIWLTGSFVYGTCEITVQIPTDRIGDVNFDYFELVYLMESIENE